MKSTTEEDTTTTTTESSEPTTTTKEEKEEPMITATRKTLSKMTLLEPRKRDMRKHEKKLKKMRKKPGKMGNIIRGLNRKIERFVESGEQVGWMEPMERDLRCHVSKLCVAHGVRFRCAAGSGKRQCIELTRTESTSVAEKRVVREIVEKIAPMPDEKKVVTDEDERRRLSEQRDRKSVV